MTVSTLISRETFTGTGSLSLFAFTFRILENLDLVIEVDGVLQVDITDYALSNLTNVGGDITFVAPPADGADIVVYRSILRNQQVDYNPYDAFPSETHETALDKLTLLAQDNSDTIVNIFPAGAAGDVLTLDGDDNVTWITQVGRPDILDQVLSSVSGVLTVDFSLGQSIFVAMTENITSTVVTGLPAAALAQIEFEIDQDSTARTWVWPSPITWIGGTPPDLTTVDSKHLVRLRTRNGGTSWMGTFGENFS